MSWLQIRHSLRGLGCRAAGRWKRAIGTDLAKMRVRDALSPRDQARYGISKAEADRCVGDWIKEPGVLDDWNDTRAILDM